MSGRCIVMVSAFPPPVTGQSLAAKLLRDGLESSGFRVISLDFGKTIGDQSVWKRICQLAGIEWRLLKSCIREHDCIIYLQLGHGRLAIIRDIFLMATSWLTRHPSIGHVHGSGFRNAYDSLSLPLRVIVKFLIEKLDAAIVLSESLKEMFDGLIQRSRVFVVDNGIDPNFVSMTNECIVRKPRSTGMNILFLSNFLTAKGFSTLLKTAVLAQERRCDWHFHFVGARIPNQDVDIDTFVREHHLQNVTIDDVLEGESKHEAYRDADVFVLPSVYEGQPLCILEAMFESLPVVTTRIGGIPEIFSSDESCVIYVEPENPEALYDAFNRLSASPELCRSMGERGRHIAQTRFTAERHIAQMIQIFDKSFHTNIS